MIMTLELPHDSSTPMNFHILYMTYYVPYVAIHIPHVSLGLYFISFITKDKLHMRQWLYNTKLIMGQSLIKLINNLLPHGAH